MLTERRNKADELRKAHVEKQNVQIANLEAQLVYKYTERFSIYEDDTNYYFRDKYWPRIEEMKKKSIRIIRGVSYEIGLFIQGFLPFILKISGVEVKDRAAYEGDNYFWQFPCATERDFFERNEKARKSHFNDEEINVYIPLPWATFIDAGSYNAAIIETLASRLKYAAKYMRSLGFRVRVHTCCQHIRWRDAALKFQKLMITDLWISHKKVNEDKIGEINLHAWSLYATNYEDKSRSKWLTAKTIESKRYIASFIGAYLPHYLSDCRLKIGQMQLNKNYLVIIKNEWHFEKIVYQGQMKALEESVLNNLTDSSALSLYNKTLSNSIFSLCPEGAGPNTIRIWESLAIGSIPVVISNDLDIPLPKGYTYRDLENIIINIRLEEVDRLEEILGNVSLSKVKEMQMQGVTFYGRLRKENILNRVFL